MRAGIHHAGRCAWSIHEVAQGLCVTNRFGSDKVASIVVVFEADAAVAHFGEEEHPDAGVRMDRTSAKPQPAMLPKLAKPGSELKPGVWTIGLWRVEVREHSARVTSSKLAMGLAFPFASNGWFYLCAVPPKPGIPDVTIYNGSLQTQLQNAISRGLRPVE